MATYVDPGDSAFHGDDTAAGDVDFQLTVPTLSGGSRVLRGYYTRRPPGWRVRIGVPPTIFTNVTDIDPAAIREAMRAALPADAFAARYG